jgi:hypothetical protein
MFRERMIIRALCLAVSAPNLAIHINFLFLETHSLIFISARVLGFNPLPMWVPDLSLECLSHPPLVVIREDDWHKCEPTLIAVSLVPLDGFSLRVCIPCRRVSVHV